MEEDLEKSGLKPTDLDARPLSDPERAMTHVASAVEGYVIPYFDIHGKILPFYRVRLFDNVPKYKQVKDSKNHIYFPKGFLSLVVNAKSKGQNYVVITEGEKKAIACTKKGIPAVALSGVDSWRTKTLILPEGTEFSAARVPGGRQGLAKAKLPSSDPELVKESSSLATGLSDFVDMVIQYKLTVIFCYDSDGGGVKYDVQRAASALAFELRHQGVQFSRIRQVILPPTDKLRADKIGLDDFLLANGVEPLLKLCEDACNRRSAFPRHPNVRQFLNSKLQNPRMSRKEVQAVGLAMLSDMDARGRRLRSNSDDQLYYFNDTSRRLIKVHFAASGREIMNDTEFSRYLYQEYGVSIADSRLVQWFSAQFSAEQPIEKVTPHKVITETGKDSIAYQINDGQYVEVSAEGLEVYDNGENGIMFESETVEAIDAAELLQHFDLQSKEAKITSKWSKVLSNVRLKPDPRLGDAIALLYYISPWLFRWRGTQLPIELVIGEAGSGKSSLYELRLDILLGYPALRNAPQDLKDWHASIANSGGLHVTDNVQLVNRDLRQRLSDELCRIVTEPQPHIEMRKLYANAELIRIPITCTFAITAIQQPFQNSDVIQRSMLIELDKTQSSQAKEDEKDAPITFDSQWVRHQLEKYGSRTEWIAHHLVVLHRFFVLVRSEWNKNYRARHRLINLEQSMRFVARVLGMDDEWIPDYLTGRTQKAMEEADWTLEGLTQYAKFVREEKGPSYEVFQFSAADIATWASTRDDFEDCMQLTNTRRLGRYLQVHKQQVQQMSGITETQKSNNRQMFHVRKTLK